MLKKIGYAMSKGHRISKEFLLTTILLIPALAGAIQIDNPLDYDTFEELIEHIIGFLFAITLALVPALVLFGAFYILTAGGDPSRVQKGQKIILYAVIGLAVMLFARGIISLLRYVLGGVS